MSKMTAFFPLQVGDNSTSSSTLEPLFTNADENIDVILDEALAEGIILGNAYIKLEEYLREGNGEDKDKGGFSELKAGRIIATTIFPRGKQTRKNASTNQVK
jgi:hypothetical protein